MVADQLATPRAVTNSAGTVIWSWAYAGNPFGEQQATSSGYVLNLRYPGQWYDAETGTADNGYRTFESYLGRYAQTDPTGFNGGISTYAYVGNDPLSHIDPTGLMPPGMPTPMGPFLPPPWLDLPRIPRVDPLTPAECMATYQDDLTSNAEIEGDALDECENDLPSEDDPNGVITCRLSISASWTAADYVARKRRDRCKKSCQ